MANMKLDSKLVDSWIERVDIHLLVSSGVNRMAVETGSMAWSLAGKLGLSREAYDISRDITDAHIVTALKKVFPNAVFKDRYHY